jgi:predicted TIM-barrel fold metal-dependent hydrolase
MAVRELGAERVLYGSDVHGRSFGSQLGRVLGADIPDDAKRMILRENLVRLLRPALKRKGIKV